ncbi:hypothetical protein [Pseudonocardia sp. KRD291]|uniref:hypothetical protein n=1 Tax=Pseudonocardia sp. KRD291 TaxID=2792007 RepID=UPI001C4A40EF|nr:hypothetical protein [Pseudonocardia sp. KRD291]MBW0106683.1 hypothetical protein [Pseudonocardia sp. KRD291]
MAASLMGSGSLGRPDPAGALIRIALQLGATSVAHVDVAAMLSGVCVALPPAAGVSGAVLMLNDPADPRDPDAQRIFTSDTAADRMALIQQRAGNGPIPAAVRGDRTLATPDLTRHGPPELAAAAADSGLVRSLVVPVPIAARTAGGLQLLGRADAVPDEHLAALLRPVVTMLAARLADVRELARLESLVASRTEDPPAGDRPAEDTDTRELRTTSIPRIPSPQSPANRIPGPPVSGQHAPEHVPGPHVPAPRGEARMPEAPPNGPDRSRRPRHRRHHDD